MKQDSFRILHAYRQKEMKGNYGQLMKVQAHLLDRLKTQGKGFNLYKAHELLHDVQKFRGAAIC